MKKLTVLLLVSIVFCFLSCARNIKNVVYPALNDDQYDSEFPYKNSSRELEKIAEAVHMVIYTAYYKTYYFERETKLREKDISESAMKKCKSIDFYNHSVSGTVTVFYSSFSNVALLASAHNVNKPDTLISYFGKESTFIQSVSIKQRERIYVPDLPGDGLVEILIQDKKQDIAILSKSYSQPLKMPLAILEYPFGSAKKLQWGSFVYLLGYPKGLKMITRGIVSDPNRDERGNFLVDAMINRGFSGGIILAIKDGAPNFEFVGIGISTSSDGGLYLVPDMDDYDSEKFIYDGDIYVERKNFINYGICRAVSVETFIDLMKSNKEYLDKKGFYFSDLYAK